MKRLSFLGVLLSCILLACSPGENKSKTEEGEEAVGTEHSVLPAFAEGQVWKYDTREHETDSRVTILKIEMVHTVEYIHVNVTGLSLKNPRAPGGISDAIGHLPYARETLLRSVTELEKTLSPTEIPELGKGYDAWQEAVAQGKAAPFGFEVKKAVEFVEVTLADD